VKAALYERHGAAAEVLRGADIERPDPGPGEVRVRVEVSGVNPTDWKLRSGATPQAIDRFQIPHHDAARLIDAVGAGVSQERLGQRSPSPPRPAAARPSWRRPRSSGSSSGMRTPGHSPRRRAQFPGAAVYALPTARTIRPPDRAVADGNDPGRVTMQLSASAGRVASAVLDRRRRGRG